jgi:hypothetical protein
MASLVPVKPNAEHRSRRSHTSSSDTESHYAKHSSESLLRTLTSHILVGQQHYAFVYRLPLYLQLACRLGSVG